MRIFDIFDQFMTPKFDFLIYRDPIYKHIFHLYHLENLLPIPFYYIIIFILLFLY
jgi:hypothetical protein